MKLEDQVVSLELCKKLRELGVNQDSIFWHYPIFGKDDEISWAIMYSTYSMNYERYSAFTVAELGEMLPYASPSSRDKEGWYMNLICPLDKWKEMYPSKTEADARAKMLIHLIENGMIPKGLE